MKTLLGPILHAEDQRSADLWTFSVNLYLAGTDASRPLPLRLRFFDADTQELADVASSEAKVAADFSSLKRCAGVLWKWTVALRRKDTQHRVTYRFESLEGTPAPVGLDAVKDIVIPKAGELPRAAFFSCNGASSADKWNRMKHPFACWKDMRTQHEEPEGGFHLLIGGGDQVYADSVSAGDYSSQDELRQLRKTAMELKAGQPPPPGLHEELLSRYVDLYCRHWSGQEGIATMLSRVPGVYTWDDHDIVDGWGSEEEHLTTAWYRAVYSAAALAFEAFQLGGLKTEDKTPREREPATTHYLQTLRFEGERCEVDFVVLDLRSGRTSRVQPNGKTEYQVLSPTQWAALDAWRKEHAGRPEKEKEKKPKARHVLLVSSVPLVHLRFGPGVENAGGMVGLRDDMLDQWESLVHRGERIRLMMDLLTLAKASSCAVTVVSGDVHVAAWGLIRSRKPEHLPEGLSEVAIVQVTSSGIVHPPPNWLEFQGMRLMSAEGVENLQQALQTEMLSVGEDRFLRERNWLSLRVDPTSSEKTRPKLWLRWEAEHTVLSTQVVVEPPPPSR
ncbi:alkaline phosphatase D family protein [Pyxidicoccus xibeiensis]|uniref:alkaline phosphatase D family protein n=1 Tax=Pyxidicoccus xibeiensis TaxID=2906759 RepID=UPI0020A7A4B7|nr:alkaline phosphatase D family protein [Pyxidicoccus xibeiensis]MCP3137090.1 alkaline phosphatase family protein [Pyxidicoccus xibeiensis]